MERRDVVAGLAIALAVVATAAIGSLAASGASDQYAELEQPSWAPPGWLFGPVWTLLYIAIAVAGFLVWRQDGRGTSLWIWVGQLAVNAAWTPLFFAWELRFMALLWIVLLDALVAWFIIRDWRSWQAWLMVPYLAWILFATALNASVWWLNR